MDLILWRHAEAIPIEEGLTDAERPLTHRGERQAARMAQWLERQLPDGAKMGGYSTNDLPPGFYLHPLKINEFLSHSPITLAGQEISIVEIIKYVANQYGGVHLAPSLQGEVNLSMARFDNIFRVGEDGIVLAQIDQIARDTLTALAPLMKVIQEKYIELDRQFALA